MNHNNSSSTMSSKSLVLLFYFPGFVVVVVVVARVSQQALLRRVGAQVCRRTRGSGEAHCSQSTQVSLRQPMSGAFHLIFFCLFVCLFLFSPFCHFKKVCQLFLLYVPLFGSNSLC